MSQLNQISAVLFDLDDTLYPERDYVRSGFQAIAKHLADSQKDVDSLYSLLEQAFEQGPRDKVFNTVLKLWGRHDSEQVIRELVNIYRNHLPNLKLDQQVSAILSRLKQQFKLGLLSDGFLPAQKLKVQALQLQDSFDHIIYTEELGRDFWKPSPQAFIIMSDTLAVPPPQCVYVADNPAKDFVAPNQLGWQTVQLKQNFQIHTDNETAPTGQAQKIIYHLGELQNLVL
jgi:putative hydrolase of the HAD superfamily